MQKWVNGKGGLQISAVHFRHSEALRGRANVRGGMRSQKANIRNIEVIVDFDSRPHKPVSFEVPCKKEPQKVRTLKVPKPLPGCTGGKVRTVVNSEQNVNVMSRKEAQDKAEETFLKWTNLKKNRQGKGPKHP